MHHLGQAVDVLDQQRAAAPFDNPNSGQAIELPGDGLPVGADPARDLDMGRRRHDAGAFAFLGPKLASRSNSAWMRLLTASVLNS